APLVVRGLPEPSSFARSPTTPSRQTVRGRSRQFAGSPPPERRLRSSVAQTVVVAAGGTPVSVDGQPARRVRLHVVDLAVRGGDVAELMKALAVAHLDRAAGRAGEDAPARAEVPHPVGTVEHHAFHPTNLEPPHQAPRRDDSALSPLTDAAGEGLLAHEHGEQRLRQAG